MFLITYSESKPSVTCMGKFLGHYRLAKIILFGLGVWIGIRYTQKYPAILGKKYSPNEDRYFIKATLAAKNKQSTTRIETSCGVPTV